MPRIFILSPANCGGRRGTQILSPRARFGLAERLRSRAGAPLGEVFSFVSGLYFRGKLAYASRFAAPPCPSGPRVGSGVHVITPTAGLRSPDVIVRQSVVRAFASGEVDLRNASYRRPLLRSARALAEEIGHDCDVVLLGSIASPKYVDVLLNVFGDRLRFPLDFVGRGDMSRGGLLLRKTAEGTELLYGPVAGAVLHGPRPPRLQRIAPLAGRIAERS
jgi:hypothetical protein